MNESILKSFEDKYKKLFEINNDFYQALRTPPSKYFRMNTGRGVDYLKELEIRGIKYFQDTNFPNVYKLGAGGTVTDTISFLTGGIYVQNPSSLYPVKIMSRFLSNLKTPVILDLCASPGGKTTAVSEILGRKGLVLANEVSKSRLKSLNFNLEKYGAWNVKTTSFDGRLAGKFFPDTFDGVLLDAPCSNENKIFRSEEVKRNWGESLIQKMQKLQKELVLSAFKSLKPGGVLVYSTCTFSEEENEDVIKHLLSESSDAKILTISEGNSSFSFSDDNNFDGNILRVIPSLDADSEMSLYDGFFTAAVKKEGNIEEIKINDSEKNSGKLRKEFNKYFDYDFNNCRFNEKKGLIFMESPININGKLYKTGLKAGKIAGAKVELSSQMFWQFGEYVKKSYRLDIDINESIDYLNGYDIRKTEDDLAKSVFLYFKGIPVGTAKYVENKLKNKLDRYFLYGR